MPATLLDIVKANGSDAVVGLVDEVSKAHPEMTLGTARTIKGISYKTLVRVGAFSGSTFRNANEGATIGQSRYENRTFETYFLEPREHTDRAVADSHEDGAPAYLAMEASAMLDKGFVDVCRQFYYGPNATFGNAKGFPGLLQSYDSTNMAVDAGGTTDSTASSVWLVKFGPKAVQWLWGNNGQFELPQPRSETLYDAGSKPYSGYTQSLFARPGLQSTSVRAVCRIKKLTADSGKGLTDSLIIDALSKFEVGMIPDVILMSRRSRSQLQKSRSVTIFSSGSGKPSGSVENTAPLPTESQSIPIMVTDSISDVETLAL